MRNVCWTLNNYTNEDAQNIAKDKCFDYVVFGFEIAPETGTPHLQGYAELAKRTEFNTVAKMYKWHIERRKGSQQQAIEYCKKEGNVVERGKKREQGHRADLDIVRAEAFENGMRGVTTWANFQGMKVAEKFLTYNEPARDWKPEVIWLWGKTGAGKSKKAREICGDGDTFTKNTGHKWWDGYDSHENIIIDDFRDSWWSLTYMLALLDRYEFQVEIKGGLRQIRAKRIVITSLYPPESMYRGVGEDIQQLIRRIESCQEILPEVPEVGLVIVDNPTPAERQEINNWLRSINFEI